MKTRQSLVGLCFFTALLLTSCVVHSIHPLSDPTKAKVDEALIGRWEYKSNLTAPHAIVLEIDRHPSAGKGEPKVPAGMMLLRQTALGRRPIG